MWLPDAEYRLGQIENGRREVVEQPEEHRVPPAVANLDVRHPDDRVARIDVRIIVQHVGEHLDGDRIAFAGRAVDQLRCADRTGAHEPADGHRGADHVVAGDQVDDGRGIARNGSEEACRSYIVE